MGHLEKVAAAIRAGDPIQPAVTAALRAGATSRQLADVVVTEIADLPQAATGPLLGHAAHAGIDPYDLLHAALDTEVTDGRPDP